VTVGAARFLDLDKVRATTRALVDAGKIAELVDYLLGQLTSNELDRRRLLRKHLGQTSERISDAQLDLLYQLLGEAAANAPIEPPVVELPPKPTPKNKPKRGHGRSRLPEDLRREERVHPVTDGERRCPHCGGERICIGYEISETLERIPAEMFVIVDKREKLACHPCEQGVVIAPAPEKVIEKGRPGPGLLADVIIGKYCDHLPLNRQSGIYLREGVSIPVSTMTDWVASVAASLQPLARRLEELVLAAHVVNADDTGIKVLDRDVAGGAKKGHLWCYIGDAQHAVFRYTPDWTKEGPQAFLATRAGWLQADAYRGYDGIFDRKDATAIEVACWAHCRRPFAELANDDDARAAPIIDLLKSLYEIEDRATEWGIDSDERLRWRRQYSAPLVEAVMKMCIAIRGQYPPSDPLAKAAGYALNQRVALGRFLEDGRLAVDNTLVERRLRPVAMGRRNYLFCGSDAGAERAAVIYSLVGSCALVGVAPRAYLTFVLEQIQLRRFPMSRLDELLPASFAKTCPASARIKPSR
jgi:transposase